MSKQYRTREGNVTVVDTKTQLSTLGSDTAPGPLMVPKGMKFIVGIIASGIQNMAAATGFSSFLRIEGPGMVNTGQTVALCAGGNAVATGGNAAQYPVTIPCLFSVVEAQEIQLFAEMAGTDVGDIGAAVTLVFSDTAPSGAKENKTLTVEGDITSVATRTALLTQGSVAAPSLIVPSGMTVIEKLVVAVAGEGLANGHETYFVRLGGNAVQGGEQAICVGASGTIAPQAGSDSAPQNVSATVLEDLQIAVNSGDSISIWAEGTGQDTGTPHIVVTAMFA
jgi:hypothetical protein